MNKSCKPEMEGGCGVVGFACNEPLAGRHIFKPSIQMHNRGNGKGGGIAAAGLSHEDLGVSKSILEEDYLLQVAFLDDSAREEIEDEFINKFLEVHKSERIPTVDDYKSIPSLEVKPPDIWRYFVRVKPEVLGDDGSRDSEDEFIYKNSFNINQKFYASLGEKRAFVLSHGRNMMILKIVGFAEDVVRYYRLEDFHAQIWIAHQRYPTKGRVWHPAGAHPFSGMHEALVHNGDFANYHSVSEYLKARDIYPQFLTDTEVAVLIFDLLNRRYNYPLEYIIEALAPTTELDFNRLSEEKQKIYCAIQSAHIHGSPDGPWFFIIARNDWKNDSLQLIGITDTAMLRPQVFALVEGKIQLGIIASEKQAIDATLVSLSEEDSRFPSIADRYWNARGGSYTDGGAFIFTIKDEGGKKKLTCTDKFGQSIKTPPGEHCNLKTPLESVDIDPINLDDPGLFEYIKNGIGEWDFNRIRCVLSEVVKASRESHAKQNLAIKLLTDLTDRRYDTGNNKRSSILQILGTALKEIFDSNNPITWDTRPQLKPPSGRDGLLFMDASGFPPEGDLCDSRVIVGAYKLGWKRFIVYGLCGQRFHGCGLGPDTDGVKIDLYGSSGDYGASGIDGLEIYLHANAQDQIGQILKRGKLVIHGDVGQTFMYGAKGGDAYVLGNAAGRPLINGVGKPRVVINGTCLDFLAESFMAGDPLNGGGFVIINGVEFDDRGGVIDQATPYPGSNLFSLASGGAIYIRDPAKLVVEEQLNGGMFMPFTEKDWDLILPYLDENERLFGISVKKDLLKRMKPADVYRKISAITACEIIVCEESED